MDGFELLPFISVAKQWQSKKILLYFLAVRDATRIGNPRCRADSFALVKEFELYAFWRYMRFGVSLSPKEIVMDQSWFEMRDVRNRKLDNGVWIPLRAVNTIDHQGRYGYIGYREEFFGAGSVAVPIQSRNEVNELNWSSIGPHHPHHCDIQEGRYIPSDIYEFGQENISGIHLVLEQHYNSQDVPEWHLHQDFIIVLNLKRENDTWVAPDEGYVEVARLHRTTNGTVFLLEVRADHLKDYLSARSMALYISCYRNRDEIVDDASHIVWTVNPLVEDQNGDRWEGRVTELHEGGDLYGTSMAVMHVSRTDVDFEEEVPNLEFPKDKDVRLQSWVKKHEGRKLYRVQGELWRNEWIEPGDLSVRIRRDTSPPTVFFITDSKGTHESKATLVGATKWLWFRPGVIMSLAHRRGGTLRWYSKDTGAVSCSLDCGVHFGINSIGLVTGFAKDIASLPDWQQKIWAGYNIGPEARVSDELLAAQMRAMPPNTKAPEELLPVVITRLNNITLDRYNFRLFREHADFEKVLTLSHRFRALDQMTLLGLAKDLARLTADSIDAAAIQKVVKPPAGQKWGSLKFLESLVATRTDVKDARSAVGPLFGIYELRHADAHLAGQFDEILKLVSIDRSLSFVFQRYQLLETCVSSLTRIADILEG